MLPQLLTCSRGISRRRTQKHTHRVVVTKTCALYFLISAELQSQRRGQVLEQVALRQVRRDWCLRQPLMAGRARTSGTHQVQGVAPGVCACVCVCVCVLAVARRIHKSLRSLSLLDSFFFFVWVCDNRWADVCFQFPCQQSVLCDPATVHRTAVLKSSELLNSLAKPERRAAIKTSLRC